MYICVHVCLCYNILNVYIIFSTLPLNRHMYKSKRDKMSVKCMTCSSQEGTVKPPLLGPLINWHLPLLGAVTIAHAQYQPRTKMAPCLDTRNEAQSHC